VQEKFEGVIVSSDEKSDSFSGIGSFGSVHRKESIQLIRSFLNRFFEVQNCTGLIYRQVHQHHDSRPIRCDSRLS
jgi:hypothetical protein